MNERQTLLARIERARADSAALLAQYGEGVRPGWISTELTINEMRVREAEAALAKLESLE